MEGRPGTRGEGLPSFFERMLRGQFGEGDARRVVDGCDVRRPCTLRANALKGDAAHVREELEGAGLTWSGVEWCDEALVLDGAREREVRELPLYTEGRVYLQGLSSMIPALVLGPRPGSDVLDMCAAPGGKTCQMAAMTGGRARITACEMHMPRAERLEYNLRLQGAAGVAVMRTDARRLDPFFRFDQVLLDAPCSGSGTLDVRDRRLGERFTEKLVEKSVRSQRALIKKAVEVLKEGGELVYSTCSVLRCENEDVVERALRGQGLQLVPIDPGRFPGVPVLPTALPGTLLVCPDGLYEGFFVAHLRKVG